MISNKHLENICLLNKGSKTCRYLYNDELDESKWYCHKLKTHEKYKIDESVNNLLLDCIRKKINPAERSFPQGDNCEGLLVLKNIKQGYDC